MTSVAVISSAVARINCLKELLKSLPDETDAILGYLEAIKELLEAGDCKNANLEREIVRLSYEIVDAMADASSPAKDKPKKATPQLQQLKESLSKSHEDLKKNDPERTIAPQGSEVEAGPEKQQAINSPRRNKNESESAAASPRRNPKSAMAPQGSEFPQKQESKRRGFLINPFRNKTKSSSTTASEIQVGTGQQQTNQESTASKVLQAGPGQNPDEEEARTEVDLLQRLKDSRSTVLYIVGESGMGKSTYARTLFDQLRKDSVFNVCAWVPLNHNFDISKILRILLQKLAPRQELGIKDMTEIELIAKIFAALKNKTYLLVLNDVNSVDDWEGIRLALPISGSTRIIITSSSTEFTPHADVYKISRMTLPNMIELLEKKASFKPGSEKDGETIFHVSGGSPLMAIILGKSLQLETNTTRHQKMVDELESYRSLQGGSKVLAACYKWLAPEIKPCLLYLSQFSRGQDIEVEKLYLLLAAENLIFSPKKSQTPLESLLDHLEELARRKLVEVQENTGLRRGNNKSYKLLFPVQRFCKSKASEEEFLESVDMTSPTEVGFHTRRLAIHLSKAGGNMSIPFQNQDTVKKILSLLIFDTSESAEEKSGWPKDINDLKDFIHLRILKFDGVNFDVRKVPTGMDKLVLLRYLSFRGCRLEELPCSLSKLTQLETLDLVVQADCQMLIHNNILTGMTRMVHLYFPRSYKISEEKTKLQLQHMERLEILVNFDMEVCDVKSLSEFSKLRILSTMSNGDPKDLDALVEFINKTGNHLEYSSVDIRSFDCYDEARVSALKKLLLCEFVDSIHIEGQIGKLPEGDDRTKRVAEIVLDGSEIEVDPMKYLGMFENLQSLVLKNDAFVGKEIIITAGQLFRNLRNLQLQNLKYLEKLIIEEEAMPKLKTMEIDSCYSLQELSIPKELDDRLKKAQVDDRGDAITPQPSTVVGGDKEALLEKGLLGKGKEKDEGTSNLNEDYLDQEDFCDASEDFGAIDLPSG